MSDNQSEAIKSLKITGLVLGAMFLLFGVISIGVTPPSSYTPNPKKLASNINEINPVIPPNWTGYRVWLGSMPPSNPNDVIGVVTFDNSTSHLFGQIKATGQIEWLHLP